MFLKYYIYIYIYSRKFKLAVVCGVLTLAKAYEGAAKHNGWVYVYIYIDLQRRIGWAAPAKDLLYICVYIYMHLYFCHVNCIFCILGLLTLYKRDGYLHLCVCV